MVDDTSVFVVTTPAQLKQILFLPPTHCTDTETCWWPVAAVVACMSHVLISEVGFVGSEVGFVGSEVGFVGSEVGWVGYWVDIKPAVQHQPPAQPNTDNTKHIPLLAICSLEEASHSKSSKKLFLLFAAGTNAGGQHTKCTI